MIFRRKTEADGFVRGLILTHNMSRNEACSFFSIGRNRFDRVRNSNPLLPLSKKSINENAVRPQDKELIRIFMKAQPMEPGYPCNHRSVAIYMQDPDVTITSLHNNYKIECLERQARCLSLETFRRIVKFILPTLHLGRTRTDVCNSCFSMDLQIKDPQTSAALKEELMLAKQMHLQEAMAMRREIKKIYSSVQKAVAPDDPLLVEDPVPVPPCYTDPFSRLNRPFLVDVRDGHLGQEEEHGEDQQQTEHGDDELNLDVTQDDDPAGGTQNSNRKLRVTVQDFGAGLALPRYGGDQPNADYYASNLVVNNMNFVNCANGECVIYYYDERVAGKDGNSVTSLRWKNLCQFIIQKKEQELLPTAEVKILDNCVGQNKSNTTHKFSMLVSLFIFPDGVTDIYFKVGHSHNASDIKTAHANKAMGKKNLFTPMMIASEINKSKGLTGEVIMENDGMFYDWKTILDKYFPNMDAGFTKYHWFEFKNGVVYYKSLSGDGEVVIEKSKTFCSNPDATKKAILRELFNLSNTSSPLEIAKAKPRLPLLPHRKVTDKKVENMKVLYPLIPRCYRWFYPEGSNAADEPHTEIRRRAASELLARAAASELLARDAASELLARDAASAGVLGQTPVPVEEVSGQIITPAVVTDKTPVPAVETNQASAPTVADEFWDGDLESSLSIPGKSTNASNSPSLIGRRSSVQVEKKVRGRPKLGTSNLKNQPAILRFLTPSQDQSQVLVRQDSTEMVKKRRRIYVVDSSDTDEDSSQQILDDNHNVQD